MDYVIKISPFVIYHIFTDLSENTFCQDGGEERPGFSIVQNLWTNAPYYELIYEADSKLPVNFRAKKGERDIIHDSVKLEEDFHIMVETYPFLVIISEVEYKYKNKTHKDMLMSTPLETIKIDENTIFHIREYLHDNCHHEVFMSNDSSSIYSKTNKQVISACKHFKENATFPGGKEGGYGYVLKKINELITPMDPMQKYYQKEIKGGWINRIICHIISRQKRV